MCSACGYDQRGSFDEFVDQELERSYTEEAFAIIAGRTMLLPQREHLEALRSYFIRGMQEVLQVLDQLPGVAPDSPVRATPESTTQPTLTAETTGKDATPLPTYIHSKFSC